MATTTTAAASASSAHRWRSGGALLSLLAVASVPPPPASAFVSGRGGDVLPNRWGPPPRVIVGGRGSGSLSATVERNDVAAVAADTAPSVVPDDECALEDGSTSDECVKTRDVLSLPSIRSTLIRQEETIIFALIERAQFRGNDVVYKSGGFGDLGVPLGSVSPVWPEGATGEEEDGTTDASNDVLSFLEYFLLGTEVLHCGLRRYTSPEEHPFFPRRIPSGPLKNLPSLDYPPDLLSSEGGASDVNFNPILLRKYIDTIVPSLTGAGDDEQHGSTVLADIVALQALSRRVHYGKFVAESKYRSDPEGYRKLVEAGDAEGVMALLTNEAVERQVLRRARLKAATYGREPLLAGLKDFDGSSAANGGGDEVDADTAVVAAAAASAVVAAVEALGDRGGGGAKVDSAAIEDIYRNIIIPLTKDIEVAYLFRRCGREPPPEYAPDRMSIDCK